MSRTMDSVATINSVVRTTLAVVIVGGVGYGGYRGYTTYSSQKHAAERLEEVNSQLQAANDQLDRTKTQLAEKSQQVVEQAATIQEQEHEIERLDTSIRLLTVDQRVARLSVVSQDQDPDTNEVSTVLDFVELDDDEQPLYEPKRFTIKGDLVYIDNLVVKFEDEYVKRADLERSGSLVLFRRIFGEFQEPNQGFPLEEQGEQPKIYSGDREPSELERRIWRDFWAIANDPQLSAELGIRALHGEAVSVRVRPGKSYKITLRASDGLSIVPDNDPPLKSTTRDGG